MRTRVKICGLTRAEDVAAAVEAGADACGFIFASSPRQVTIERAAALTAVVPPAVARFGVFVDAEPRFVAQAVNECGLTAVQLSGKETPHYMAELGRLMRAQLVKVLKVGTEFSFTIAEPYRELTAAYLLDTHSDCKAGGTSQAFNWQRIGEVPRWAPFFCAGGLTSRNVSDAIRLMKPYAVDVSSGVESSPGIKDAEKIKAFMHAVRAVDGEVYG